MTSTVTKDTALPPTLQEGLAVFCEQLLDILKARLVSAILYGGLAKGEYVPETSDVNLMIVLDKVTVDALDHVAPVIQGGARDFRLSAMLVGESDLRRSAEVFPIKFLDMQRNHRVLWGKDVLANLTISRDHVRLRCAQEINNLLLRLRQFYVQRAHRPELIESTLTRAISSFLTSLSTLVELKTGRVLPTKSGVIFAVPEIGLDSRPLQEVFALKQGELKPNLDGLKHLYDDFMMTVQQAAELVDTV
jgi:predicted nucleotidyltransferase